MRVLIADDHIAIRIGLKYILSAEFGKVSFAEASTSAKALQMLENEKWDLIILDIGLPGRSGLDVLKQMSDSNNKSPVLVFSFHKEHQFAIRALKAGAAGFLSKDSPDTEIIKAIRQILVGRKFITLSVAESMIRQLNTTEQHELHENLSDREFETLLLIASGKTVSQIAKELSLSVPTISTYRARILEKMQMKTNAELMQYVLEKKLI